MVCSEADLELFSLWDDDGDLLDLQEDIFICCIRQYRLAAWAAICLLLCTDFPLLLCWLSVPLQSLVDVVGNVVEQGNPAGRVCACC